MQPVDPLVGMWKTDVINYLDTMALCQRNQNFTAGGLTIGTTANTSVKLANTITYTSEGVLKSKATAEVAFSGASDNIPANAASVQERVWYVTVNGAGTLALVAGAIATGSGNALLPERNTIPDGTAIIGTVRIAVAAGSTSFTANTTALNNGALTVTYTDMNGITPLFGAPGTVPGGTPTAQ